jgi:hypothetical protein
VSDEQFPVAHTGSTARPLWRRRGVRRGLRVGLAVILVLLIAATARLFVWPDRGMPSRVSAIVMLDVPGLTTSPALHLAAQHRAPILVISQGGLGSSDGCPRPVPRVTLICFHPSPGTTQGEAEFAGRLARKYHWRSIALVTITPHDSRARLRLERCFAGPVYVVATPIPLRSWPYQIVYEWGALAKALILQRAC